MAVVVFVRLPGGGDVNRSSLPQQVLDQVRGYGRALVDDVLSRAIGGIAVQAGVFEVEGDNMTLAGIVAAKARVAYRTNPGKHLFMVIGENAGYMSAELLPNKIYYAYVVPRMGIWKSRFSFEPIHRQEMNTPEFDSAINECRWVEKTPDSDKWMIENIESIKSKHAKYYPEWMALPENERARLLPEDGW